MGGGRIRTGFFYLPLCSGKPLKPSCDFIRSCIGFGGFDYILGAYGIQRFLAEIDRSTGFHEGGIIGSILDFIASEGFEEVFERHNLVYKSSREYRERYNMKHQD